MCTLAACTLCELQINKVCSPHENLYTHTLGSTFSLHSSADEHILIEAQSTFATLERKRQWKLVWNCLNEFFRSRTVKIRNDLLILWLWGWCQHFPIAGFTDVSVFQSFDVQCTDLISISPQSTQSVSKVQKDNTYLTHSTSPACPSRTSFLTLTYHLGKG